MNRAYQANQLHRWLNEFHNFGDAGGLVTLDGEILSLRYETLADIGTLSATATTVAKYFPLKDGDAVILNDPYSGGSLLSTISIVTPLILEPTPIFWVVRTGFKPRLSLAEKLDEEGLRIPPTPLVQGRTINSAILSAISGHPLCPVGFETRLQQTLPLMWARIDNIRALISKNKDIFSKANLKFYQKLTNDWLVATLQDLPHGDAKVELPLDTGEVIRLHAEIMEGQINLDFSGTSASKRVCLTEVATFGCCIGALSAFLQKDFPMNSGIFSYVNVVTPLGSMLNSKYPSPTFKGMTEGASLVASTVLMALSEIVPSKRISMSASSPAMISFEFAPESIFFDSIHGGSGASLSSDGTDAIHYWVRNRLQPSIEEIERRYPLIIKQTSVRQGSGGKGQHRGGHGMTKEFEMLGNSIFHWTMEHKKSNPQGQKGAQQGHGPSIVVHKKDGEEIEINDSQGKLHLTTGDRVFVSSGGGGGSGKA